MIKVYFQTENGSYSEEVAQFKDEETFMLCKITLIVEAKKQGMIMTESCDLDEVEEAKNLLEEKGYFTGNLQHYSDIEARFSCNRTEAKKVLQNSFDGEYISGEINIAIQETASALGFEEVEED